MFGTAWALAFASGVIAKAMPPTDAAKTAIPVIFVVKLLPKRANAPAKPATTAPNVAMFGTAFAPAFAIPSIAFAKSAMLATTRAIPAAFSSDLNPSAIDCKGEPPFVAFSSGLSGFFSFLNIPKLMPMTFASPTILRASPATIPIPVPILPKSSLDRNLPIADAA